MTAHADLQAPPSFTRTPWQMTYGERFAFEGVLSQLKPQLAIEIGTAEGGSLSRIAEHSAEVHSFDLVAPKLVVGDNVTLHGGDSHIELPKFLAQLAAEGRSVDFVLVDGDHSADGVRRDMIDLLESDAIKETVILIHDTINEEVRGGIEAVDYLAYPKVAHVDFDAVPGTMSVVDGYRGAIWGGLGLVVVSESGRFQKPASDVIAQRSVSCTKIGLGVRELLGDQVAPQTDVAQAVRDLKAATAAPAAPPVPADAGLSTGALARKAAGSALRDVRAAIRNRRG